MGKKDKAYEGLEVDTIGTLSQYATDFLNEAAGKTDSKVVDEDAIVIVVDDGDSKPNSHFIKIATDAESAAFKGSKPVIYINEFGKQDTQSTESAGISYLRDRGLTVITSVECLVERLLVEKQDGEEE